MPPFGRKASEQVVTAVEVKPGHFQVIGGDSLPGAAHLDHIGGGGCSGNLRDHDDYRTWAQSDHKDALENYGNAGA